MVGERNMQCTIARIGYFAPREGLWAEPIYRNVWSLLREFGDAEVAALVAPRALVVEASCGPLVTGPPPASEGRQCAAPGRLESPALEDVRAEFERAQRIYELLGAGRKITLTCRDGGSGPPVRSRNSRGVPCRVRHLHFGDCPS